MADPIYPLGTTVLPAIELLRMKILPQAFVCGKRMSETLATGRVPDILHAFRLSRFEEFHQVGERGAASVGT